MGEMRRVLGTLGELVIGNWPLVIEPYWGNLLACSPGAMVASPNVEYMAPRRVQGCGGWEVLGGRLGSRKTIGTWWSGRGGGTGRPSPRWSGATRIGRSISRFRWSGTAKTPSTSRRRPSPEPTPR